MDPRRQPAGALQVQLHKILWGDEPAAMKRSAVVLLSGGLDSATVLAWRARTGFECHALRELRPAALGAELAAAARVAALLGAVEHRADGVDLAGIGGSALTDT
jgi:7-cyano-7-deazaguanine synthase